MQDKIQSALEAYTQAAAKELETFTAVDELQAEFDLEKARVIEGGYSSGELNGKNAEARGRQEALLVDSRLSHRAFELRQRKLAHAIAKRERTAAEYRIGLLKAYLHSLRSDA